MTKALGKGGQSQAESQLGWDRSTIRKGLHELEAGIRCEDNFAGRGRKPAEDHLPNLLKDIDEIVGDQSQIDKTFSTCRLYTRLTAKEVRRQLRKTKGYSDSQLPTEETIRVKLNQLGYHLRPVIKNRPEKKIPETDAIFDQLNQVHKEAVTDETILRISLDAKATVNIGPFCRGGVSRVEVSAVDHDFAPDEKLTPFGIFRPDCNQLYLYLTPGRITSDFIADCLLDFWAKTKAQLPKVKTLLINSDNGPECQSRRTQFMNRITEFADEQKLEIHLAYYPPYHSKYNPIERVFGVLEQHWNGSLLDSVQTVINFAKTMSYNGVAPVVQWVQKAYQTGIRLTAKQMEKLEERFERFEQLPKWFVKIAPIFA